MTTTLASPSPSTTLPAPAWIATSTPPLPPRYFATDHWRLLTDLAAPASDNSHDGLRCDPVRHPYLLSAGSHLPDLTTSPPSTVVAGPVPGTRALLADHDDYDCIDDLVAAGLVVVTMPTADSSADLYRAPDGRVCVVDGVALCPSFSTPVTQALLARFATPTLTPKGHFIASYLIQTG